MNKYIFLISKKDLKWWNIVNYKGLIMIPGYHNFYELNELSDPRKLMEFYE